jgi:predicted nucleic acid-binding protein
MNTSIGNDIAPIIENPNELIIPTITIYEVYKKLVAEKDEKYATTIIDYMRLGTVIALDSNLSILAAQISREYKLPMADSIIYATSLQFSAILWTADKHLKDVPNVKYFSKTN